MKKRVLFISFTAVSICLILILIKVEFLSNKTPSISINNTSVNKVQNISIDDTGAYKVPYTPIDYNSVDKVWISGFANKTSTDLNIKKLAESINEIKKYEQRDIPVNHSTPGPNWSIIITLKDKQSITIYEDYDGQTKISNWQKSYIIDKAIAEQVLKENNLQKQMP